MIRLIDKQQIILLSIRDGKSQRAINRLTGISRSVIRKYLNEYNTQRQELLINNNIDKTEIINSIVEKPKYNASNRKKVKLTDEIVDKIQGYLDENNKRKLAGLHKQCRKKIDIYEELVKKKYDIGYTTVCICINKLENKAKEAFIRGNYTPGDICEFDWGVVKIWIKDKLITLKMAAFCTAYGNFRFGKLYVNEKTESFMDSHTTFFSYIEGNHSIMVYDNMKTAVKSFVGPNEKEPTDDLLKMSMYYDFKYRFCNTYAGNEKGHVERTVEFLRRKAFSSKIRFNSLDEANLHLLKICEKLNNKPQKAKDGKSPFCLLEEEKKFMAPNLPAFDCAIVKSFRVNKYSTINVDTCFYSVPDHLVKKMIFTKIYVNKIIMFYEEQKIAEHKKLLGFSKWSIQLEHYLNTFKKKPGAVQNSLALHQANIKIKNLYNLYYTEKSRDFIELILFMKNNNITINKVEKAIDELSNIAPANINTETIKALCNRKTHIKYSIGNNSSTENAIYNKSRYILSMYSGLLKDFKNNDEYEVTNYE